MDSSVIPDIDIRAAKLEDFDFVVGSMVSALGPYYGGDHRAHAERIFSTHIAGGQDQIGFFSLEQKMFVITLDGEPAGIVHIVAKRQGTYKISPLVIAEKHRGKYGLGSRLLEFVEDYATNRNARQMYCTVAEQNMSALQFFQRHGYLVVGRSDSHYKPGMTEVMMCLPLSMSQATRKYDKMHITVCPLEEKHNEQVRAILLRMLPGSFTGIDSAWVDALFEGYTRRDTGDVNLKYKLLFVAVDRTDTVLGVSAATPKKGEPIKLMPLVAVNEAAYVALLIEMPYLLRPYGRKIYAHVTPSMVETIALQQRGWKLDAALPGAYAKNQVVLQWSLDMGGEDFIRIMRVKDKFLKLIIEGRKTLEVRVAYESIRAIQPGERIRLTSRTKSQLVRVRAVRRYGSFASMLLVEDADLIAPGLPTDKVRTLLQEIYPPDRERLGVIVLDIEPDETAVAS